VSWRALTSIEYSVFEEPLMLTIELPGSTKISPVETLIKRRASSRLDRKGSVRSSTSLGSIHE